MTMISVFGGLSTFLKILMTTILLVVKKFEGRFNWRAIQTWFRGFTDRRRFSARLNTILISMVLAGLYLSYTFKKYQQVKEVAKEPSIELFLDLVQHYPSGSLQCPCSQASISYNSFINISVTKCHQICSNEFLTFQWLDTYLPRHQVMVLDPISVSDFIPTYF